MPRTSVKSVIGAVLEQASASPVPIREIEIDPTTKRVRVVFADAPQPASTAPAAVESRKFVPGTQFSDDASPLSAIEIALSRPTYEVD